jgi:hypothetical protein
MMYQLSHLSRRLSRDVSYRPWYIKSLCVMYPFKKSCAWCITSLSLWARVIYHRFVWCITGLRDISPLKFVSSHDISPSKLVSSRDISPLKLVSSHDISPSKLVSSCDISPVCVMYHQFAWCITCEWGLCIISLSKLTWYIIGLGDDPS